MFLVKFYFLYSLLLATIIPKNGEIIESSCSSLLNFNSSIICSINYFVPQNYFTPTCTNSLQTNTLVLEIPVAVLASATSKKLNGIFNISISCTSNYPMGINLESNDPFIKVSSKEIRQRRIINEYYNVSTYSHILSVFFPRDSIFRVAFESALSKYEVFNFQAPAEKLQMFFEYIFAHKACRMYKMQEISTAIPPQMVTIPCISFLNDSSSPKLKINDTFDNSVAYDKTMGFQLNMSNYFPTTGNYSYSCHQSGCKHHYSFFPFTDFEMTPFTKSVYITSGPKFSILKGKLDSLDVVKITCTSFTEKVRLEIKNLNGKHDFNFTHLNFDSTEHEFSRPTRYVTTVTIRYVNMTERLKVPGGFRRPYSGNGHVASINCLNSTSTELDTVDVYFDAQPPLSYLAEKKVFVCQATNYEEARAFILGHETNFTVFTRIWNCKSYIQCRFVMLNCVQNRELQHNAELVPVCAELLQNTKEESCMQEGNFVIANEKICKNIAAGEKGIVECMKSSARSNSELSLAHLYFFGFDSQMYFELDMNEEPPLNATLRLINLSVEKLFYTKGKFSFKCEAHSFFYNEGLQWLMEFENGSVIHIPKDSTFEAQTENYNAESTIDFHFHDKTLSKIICSAPHVTTMEWSNISLEISMEESISAKIISSELEVYFTIGKDEALICYAIGLPRPTVKWTKHNQTINRPLRVISETLIFPNYNSSFDGEYTCTVDNEFGQDIKKFVVKTKKENAESYYIVVISLFATVVGFISILWFIYSKREAKKKEEEMKELISLLNGANEKAENDGDMEDDDVTKRLFDVNYEIEKNTFYIDHKSPLGKGVYGQVFKGYLDGVDGPVAFKTLAPNSPIVNLKALISELKIMMYIGPHDNLVTLIGAYRKEIKQGVLYVAMELCGWGSLESFLKANKHFFIKYLNPLTVSEDVQSTDCQNYVENSVSYTLYSIKNLCKWCAQIANGMEYLGLKKVIHSDLAIRNVLLTAEGIAKVTDFGLSRRTFNYSEYVKQGNDPLPWRYLAIESLVSKVYTCQSDVWSYGITLWEIFSLGEIPYPGLSYTLEFTEQIKNGMRNIPPKYATERIYDLMCRCWELEPEKRPSFFSLKVIFKNASENENADIAVTNDMDIETTGIEMANHGYSINI